MRGVGFGGSPIQEESAVGWLLSASALAATLFDHRLELFGLGRLIERLLEGDEAAEVQTEERLVQRHHSVLVLADLHQAVDLMDLILADEVPDRLVGHEDLHREAAP